MAEQIEGSPLAQWIKTNIAPLVTVATFIAVLFGGYAWIDARYAKAEQVSQLERRLDIKTTGDFLQQTQARIWQLEDRLKTNPNDVTAQEELRKLKEEKEQLQKDFDRLKYAPKP